MVVGANGGLHDVGNRRAAVHDDPLAIVFAFNAGLAKTSIAHRVTYAGCQRLGLAVRRAGCNDDPLKQRGDVLGVKHHNVLPFDVFQAVDDGALEFLDVFFLKRDRSFGGCGHAVFSMRLRGCNQVVG